MSGAGKTQALREIISGTLAGVCPNVCYEDALDSTPYPYIVYRLSSINLEKIERDDHTLTVDVWDKSPSAVTVELLADQIEELFNAANLPGGGCYPTFYKISRQPVYDENKKLKRRQLRFSIQNYYEGAD